MSRRWLLRVAKKWPGLRPGLPRVPHPLPVELAHIAQWFHAVSDTRRLAILECLSQRDRYVTELQQILDVPQSSVSFHLKVLSASGLVRAQRSGRRTYYALMGATVRKMIGFANIVGPGAHVGTCPLDSCR